MLVRKAKNDRAIVQDDENIIHTRAQRISKRGSVLKVRGGCHNYRFKLYK